MEISYPFNRFPKPTQNMSSSNAPCGPKIHKLHFPIMRPIINTRYILAAGIVLLGCLLGFFFGFRELHSQHYFGWKHLCWRTIADLSLNGALAGFVFALFFLSSWRIGGLLTPDYRRRVRTVAGAWLLGAGLLILLWEKIPAVLAKGGSLPFFCSDLFSFETFFQRALSLKLLDTPLLWGVIAAWFLLLLVLVGLAVRLLVRPGEITTPATMSRRRLIIILTVTLVAVIVPQAGARLTRPSAPTDQPNILLISIDTLRPDRLGCYGGPARTPNIDRLAERGTRLDNALSASPWTLPSHAAMLSGKHPADLGIRAVTDKIPAEATLVSEYLLAKGFATAAFVSHLFVSQVYGFEQGFERFDYIASEQASDVARQAGEWIEAQNKSWFVLCHFFDPHWPYSLTGEADDDLRQTKDYARALRAAVKDPASARDTWLPIYDKEIERVDQAIGQLLNVLARKNMLDNTAILLVADHGEAFGEYPSEDGEDRFDPAQPGVFGHGITCQPSVIRVPFIVYGANLENVNTQSQVSLSEVPALIAAIIGEAPHFTFTELSSAWTRQERPTDPLVVETSLGGKARFGVYDNGQFLLSPVDVSYLDLHLSLPARRKHITDDGGAKLNGELEQYLARYYKKSDERVVLSPNEIERLKQLGYIGATP